MKNYIRTIALFFLLAGFCAAQGTSGTDAKYEYRKLIDIPTAGILEKGFVGVSVDVMPLGVVIPKIEVGVFDNISFGISYGGANIIGEGIVDWYKYPGVNLRVRVMNDSEEMPAVTVGFDSQGKGQFLQSVERFQIKSPGIFAAASKNYDFLGYLSLHGAVNYSFENKDGDKDFNIAVGVEKTIGPAISFIAEYNFANNDNTAASLGSGTGILNMGLRWAPGNGFTLGVDLRDLLDNKKVTSSKADRALFFEYIKAIF